MDWNFKSILIILIGYLFPNSELQSFNNVFNQNPIQTEVGDSVVGVPIVKGTL